MSGVSAKFARGERRGATARVRLASAYRNVFRGEDGQIVLADLAEACGFGTALPRGTSADLLRDIEGEKRLFARIIKHVGMTDGELAQLETAARLERITTREEGEI